MELPAKSTVAKEGDGPERNTSEDKGECRLKGNPKGIVGTDWSKDERYMEQ
jgi:hypothetical protein